MVQQKAKYVMLLVCKVKSPFYVRLNDGAKSYKVEMMNNRKNLRNEIGV